MTVEQNASLTEVLAHGVGTRTDLPIPTSLALAAAGLTVAVSFLAIAVLWRSPRLQDPGSGVPTPNGLQQVVDSPVFRRVAQAVALTVAALITAVAFLGPDGLNIAVWAVYVTFWVGLIPASLLLGPVWAVLNPLRLLHRLLAPIVPTRDSAPVLDRLGYWPAALALGVFVWLELVYPDRTDPSVVGVFLLAYAVAQLAAALWFGERWFSRGDGFEVYSRLIARLSPWGRRPDGRLVLRNPLRNAATLSPEPGLAAVVVVLLGSTAFDGLTRTQFWTEGPGSANDTVSGTTGLVASIGIVAVLYIAGAGLNGAFARQNPDAQPGMYAHTIVPIAVGYAIAHYFSLLLIDGQMTWILASNPFDMPEVDLFGTYGNAVNYTVVSTSVIAWVQVAAVVVGHVLGVVLAHDQALQATPRASAATQLPLVLVMIVFTVAGLGLLLNP